MIDRKKRVLRHLPTLNAVDLRSPFQVGNGHFSFGADVTGLQTLEREYNHGLPLATMSQTLWHDHGINLAQAYADYPRRRYASGSGRLVPYLTPPCVDDPEAMKLRTNPHRLHMGRIFFASKHGEISSADLSAIEQKMDYWSGILHSRFRYRGELVEVRTACRGDADELAVEVHSSLLADGTLTIHIAFPYGNGNWHGNGADWNQPERHQTIFQPGNGQCRFLRQLDSTHYEVQASGTLQPIGNHEFEWQSQGDSLAITILFLEKSSPLAVSIGNRAVFASSEKFWREFWESGQTISLERSTAANAEELERRMVASEYLTRIHCSGTLPPAETGLACNSWSGLFHLEMHWFHGIHFDAWERPELFAASAEFYRKILPVAEAVAREQGFRGCRWPKSCGPDGIPVPSPIGTFLLWQQMHPVYYAETAYHRNPAQALAFWGEIVEKSCEFLADFFYFSPADQLYHLERPLIDAAEIYRDPEKSCDPNFEIAYAAWALEVGQLWRTRQGRSRDNVTDRILARLPAPAKTANHYVAGRSASDTFSGGKNYSHPMLIAPTGMFPSPRYNREIMVNTLKKVQTSWDWNRESWGWDYPLFALTATEAGQFQAALDVLLLPALGNSYSVNGHNYQHAELPCYLPGNGALLLALSRLSPHLSETNSPLKEWRFDLEKP